jgi:hypothetical protein
VPRNPVLGTIVDLVATLGDTEVVLTWSAPVGAVVYQIEYKEASSETWLVFVSEIVYPSQGVTVHSLTNTVEYDLRVIASNGFTTTTSNEDSATPTADTGMVVVDDLVVDAVTDTTLTVEWTMGEDGEGNPAKYVLRYRTPTIDEDSWGAAFATEVFVDTGLATSGLKTHQFTGLPEGTAFGVILKPYRGTPNEDAHYGDFSNVATDSTTGSPTLGTIDDLSPSAGDTQVILSWSLVENATSYQPRFNDGGGYEDFGSPLGASAVNVTVTGLTNDVEHDFIVVASDGVTTTNSNEVSATPADPGDEPFLPSGMALLGTNNFSAIPGSGWQLAGGGRYSITSDAGAPESPNDVLQYRLPGGTQSGTGNDQIILSVNHRILYAHVRGFKISAGWFGDQSSTNKMGFVVDTGTGAGGDPFFFLARGIGTNALRLSVAQQGSQGNANLNYSGATGVYSAIANAASPSASDATFTRDVLYDMVYLFTANTPGSSNGRVEVWKKPSAGSTWVKILDYSGLEPLAPGSDGTFDIWKWYPIWGGNSGLSSPEDAQFFWIDHVTVWGKN